MALGLFKRGEVIRPKQHAKAGDAALVLTEPDTLARLKAAKDEYESARVEVATGGQPQQYAAIRYRRVTGLSSRLGQIQRAKGRLFSDAPRSKAYEELEARQHKLNNRREELRRLIADGKNQEAYLRDERARADRTIKHSNFWNYSHDAQRDWKQRRKDLANRLAEHRRTLAELEREDQSCVAALLGVKDQRKAERENIVREYAKSL